MLRQLDIDKSLLAGIAGLASAVVLIVVWAIFAVIGFVGFAFSLGSVETLTIAVIVVGVVVLAVFSVHLTCVAIVLVCMGSNWRQAYMSAIAGGFIALVGTWIFRTTIAFFDLQIGRPVADTVAPLVILSVGCPVVFAILLNRKMPLPAVIGVTWTMTILIGSLWLEFFWPQAVAFSAWIILPALGGLLGGPAGNVMFPMLRDDPAAARSPSGP